MYYVQEDMPMEKECRITINGMRINSFIQSTLQAGFEAKKNEISSIARDEFDEAEDDSEIERIKELLENFSPERMICPETEFTTFGTITNENSLYKISFDDAIGDVFGSGKTTFCISDKKTLSLIKQNRLRESLTFRSGKRLLCDYNDRIKSPITLYSRNVDCDINESGGRIELDYFVEINSSVCEHSKFSITVRT